MAVPSAPMISMRVLSLVEVLLLSCNGITS
jgi:hypothetical protein